MATESSNPVSEPAKAQVVAPVAKKKKGAMRAYLILAGVAVLAVAGYFAHSYLTRNEQSTDDAQVDADVVPVSTRVGGVVLHMKVHDNEAVKAGQLIAEIDPADYQAKIDAAQADLDSAKEAAEAADAQVDIVKSTSTGGLSQARASLVGSSASVRSAAAQVALANAQLARAQADLSKAEADLARAKKLNAEGAVSQVMLENAQATRDSAKAAVDAALAGVSGARDMQSLSESRVTEAQGKVTASAPVEQQVRAASAQARLAHAKVAAAEAALTIAKLQDAYTKITAPVDGYASRLAVREGQLVQPGTTFLMVVPSTTYVIANFKETQLERIRAGDEADIEIDAMPGTTFHGVVDSIAPGTGARFSMMPPDNASGNFVKVVQRVPVKITWSSADKQDVSQLHAGLSAEVTVHLK
jgi:membrane fusion protein (multidrug efflux system)